MVVMLRQCCCGCSLKTGTIIIGVLNLIGACISLGFGVFTAQEHENLRTLGIVEAVVSAVVIIICILLLVGAIKDKPALLTPWIICTIIATVLSVILYIIAAVNFFKMNDSASGISNIVGAIIYALLQIYFVLVVYSLYRELKGTA